ncbi:MAG: DNA repair protein RadA [Chlamydiia bacterium]|nr:DNA repair protein RadA [Chlamydiia bacterium]
MAVKQKNVWYCQECGHKQTKWSGQCPTCSQWNTLQEELEVTGLTTRNQAPLNLEKKPLRLKDVSHDKTPRMTTLMPEFDRLIGGGIVPGCLTLVGGEPGVGKSTLMLQLANQLAKQEKVVLYISGEESIEQTSLRAKRLGIETDNLLIFNETHLTAIKNQIDQIKPDLLIVDSIQIVYKGELSSAPGSVSQVRETTTDLMYLAKDRGMATFLIGHVTKTGEIAGPKILEHLVDTVLYFEGDKQHHYRMIRVVKNRFGATDEIAVFQMQTSGLREIPNPSEIFLEERKKQTTGSTVVPTLEGSRPILIEIQALVTKSSYSTPSRRCTGLDQNRLALLLAVLEKRMQYSLYQQDVFVSVAGGLKVSETGVDLGVVTAVASSLRNKALDPEVVVLGEVGLGGELRTVPRIESRLKEALHMGFTKAVIPQRNLKGLPKHLLESIQIRGVESVNQAVDLLIR